MLSRRRFVVFLLAALVLAALVVTRREVARSGAGELWQGRGGETTVWFNRGALEPLGVRLAAAIDGRRTDADRGDYRAVRYAVDADSTLRFRLRGEVFERLEDGALAHRGGPVLELPDGRLDLHGFRLVRGEGRDFGLAVADAAGTVWFHLDHAQEYIERQRGAWAIGHMDLRLAPAFAVRLGRPELASMAVGGLEVEGIAVAPVAEGDGLVSSAVADPPGACAVVLPSSAARPDVRIIRLAQNWDEGTPDGVNFHRCGRDDGHGGHTLACSATSIDGLVVLSPDASLQNVGKAVAAWHPKFSPPAPPYANDQHPVLVWNLYRLEADGRLRPLGISAAKHAFHTINRGCPCQQGELLFPGCQDTYSGFSNDFGPALGPRSEVVPRRGLWGRCGSLFDRDCDGKPDPGEGEVPDAAFSRDKHLVVTEAELSAARHPGARWFLEYWYVVRDNATPYDGIGLVELTSEKVPGHGTDPDAWIWRFSTGEFRNGPMAAYWHALAPAAAHSRLVDLDAPDGRVRVVGRATPLGEGRWRYDYAVFNLDYTEAVIEGKAPDLRVRDSHGLDAFGVPLPKDAAVAASGFTDTDADPANDWPVTHADGRLRWRAPGAADLGWGRSFAFSLTTDRVPVEGRLELGHHTGKPFDVVALVPGTGTAQR